MLENRLVGGRFWLPSRQEIEIGGAATWLDYPVRGIIRGRWEIGDYRVQPRSAAGDVRRPRDRAGAAAELRSVQVDGARSSTRCRPTCARCRSPTSQRVQAEARAARARAGAGARAGRDALGAQRLGLRALRSGRRAWRSEPVCRSSSAPASSPTFARATASTTSWCKGGVGARRRARRRVVDSRCSRRATFAIVGDVAERSTAVNSLAAQEFGSDYTDPYLVRAVGLRAEAAVRSGLRRDSQRGVSNGSRPLAVRAHAGDRHVRADRSPSRTCTRCDGRSTSTRAAVALAVRDRAGRPRAGASRRAARIGGRRSTVPSSSAIWGRRFAARSSRRSNVPFGDTRLVTSTTVAGVGGQNTVDAPQRSRARLPRRARLSARATTITRSSRTSARPSTSSGACRRRSCRSRSAGSVACPRAARSRRTCTSSRDRTTAGRVHVERRFRWIVAVRRSRGCIRRSALRTCCRSTSSDRRRARRGARRPVDVQRRCEPRVLEHPLSSVLVSRLQ